MPEIQHQPTRYQFNRTWRVNTGGPPGGSPPPGGSNQRDADRVVRVARAENLTAVETKAWDYYDAICDGGDMSAL